MRWSEIGRLRINPNLLMEKQVRGGNTSCPRPRSGSAVDPKLQLRRGDSRPISLQEVPSCAD